MEASVEGCPMSRPGLQGSTKRASPYQGVPWKWLGAQVWPGCSRTDSPKSPILAATPFLDASLRVSRTLLGFRSECCR